MALKFIVDKIEDVPEALRAEYVEKDGKFQLAVEDLEDTTPLKRALGQERTARAELDKKIKGWEKLGKTPDEIQEMIAAAEHSAEEKLRQDGEWDKLKSQMNARHQEELKVEKAKVDAKDKDIVGLRTTLENQLIEAEATAAIAASKGVPDLLLPHVQKHVKAIPDKDGKYSLQVVDGKGDPRVNGKGDPLTVLDLVTEMKGTEIYGRAFEGSGATGSGMRPNAGNGRSNASGITSRKDFKNEKERSAFIDTHGLEAYQALPMSSS